MHLNWPQIAMCMLARIQVTGRSPFGCFAKPYNGRRSELSRLNSVNVTGAPAAKSDLTEKLPLLETSRFAGLAPAICRVGCAPLSPAFSAAS